ncbi:hypothetical protein PHYPSEUDO_008571 [Phytophthora pseudosyringae]|uniref:Uncharacterized protein n=1 Tax=Phytophthora pseudosyringae TaxID=221518 RepID=A0A8T1VDM7_9STRA|nr:hypothetical protein PHYPSEUDO_008571 [Phytophthora pseudosyringae]
MFWLGILAIAFVAGVCGEQSSMTTLMMYEDDSCTSPATTVGMWQELACVPQNDRENPVCERSGESYAVSDCMDYGSVFYEAFYANETWHPFVYVEKYDASAQGSWWCQQDTLENATAYRLDGPPGACYVHHSGTTSSKIAIDQSLLTYTTYSDPSCNDVVSKTQTTWSMAMNAHCSNSLRIGIIGLSTSDMKAVTVFDESQCSETPVKLTLTYGFECTIGNQDDVSSQCEPTGSSHYSISNCTSGYYSDYTTNTFGNYTPHLIMQEWDNSNCNGFQNVTAYIADGICHSNTDDTTSFKVTITADSTAEITTYLDTDCGAVGNSTTVTKRQLLSQSCILHRDCDNIYGCGRSFSVGGFDSPPTGMVSALLVFDDSSCAGTPVQLVISNGVPCSTSEASTCEKISVGGNKRFGYRDCISDVVKQTAAVFGDTSYVVMEEYVDGTTCKAIKGTVVYKADGNCHPSIVDGTYFKISPSLDSSLTFATYPNSFCNAFDADYITVGTKYINFDACYEGNMKLFTNMPASSVPTNPTTPVTDVDLMTREQIMFPEWLWEPSPRRVFESD